MRSPRRSSKLVADINITPFTDVILVLLIIFMVTTPLIYRSSIKIALPQVSSHQEPIESKGINVSITRNGEVYMENQRYNLKMDMDLFKFHLKNMMKTFRDPSMIINGDRNVKYRDVIVVIDTASKVGIKHLVLATEFKH